MKSEREFYASKEHFRTEESYSDYKERHKKKKDEERADKRMQHITGFGVMSSSMFGPKNKSKRIKWGF